MSNNTSDRPNTIPWPPIIVVCTIAIGIILNGLYDLGSPFGVIGELLFGLGVMIIFIGILIDVAAMRTMRNAKTTILPHKSSDHLVTKSVFAFSRNPIYLANAMLIFGLGLAFSNYWLCLLMPVAAFATQKLAIEREEKHLETRFGGAFRSYKKKVNRWI
ncbi:MAG: isoprenylcysteine carboxylmethyltransferase family protein [Pseudomonadota bacterium]